MTKRAMAYALDKAIKHWHEAIRLESAGDIEGAEREIRMARSYRNSLMNGLKPIG